MTSFIFDIYAFLALIPLIPFLLVLFITYSFKKDRKRSIQMAMDVTTFFLIGIVAAMYDEIFPGSVINGIWIILLFFLVMAGLLGNAQTRLKGKINYRKLIRVIWRISFLILSVLYIIFFIIGLIKSMSSG